jgi:hypothetical protein
MLFTSVFSCIRACLYAHTQQKYRASFLSKTYPTFVKKRTYISTLILHEHDSDILPYILSVRSLCTYQTSRPDFTMGLPIAVPRDSICSGPLHQSKVHFISYLILIHFVVFFCFFYSLFLTYYYLYFLKTTERKEIYRTFEYKTASQNKTVQRNLK